MQGGTGRRIAALISLAFLFVATEAQGQHLQGVDHPAYEGEPGPAARTVHDDQASPELAARVAELEQAVHRAADNQPADRQKAAGRPSINVQGLVQVDTAMFSQDADSRIQFPKGTDVRNGIGFRRARLGATGEAFEVVEYRVEMEFSALASARNATDDGSLTLQQTAFKDTWLGIKELPLLGFVRIGHTKEPFGLEQLTRDRFGTFMERSVADEGALVPGRNLGVMASNYSDSERSTWAVGAFVASMPDTPPLFRENNGGAAGTTRGTFLPWYDEATEGRRLLHTGVAYSYRVDPAKQLAYSARPESFLGPTVVTTVGQFNGTNADVDHNHLLGAEAALVYGPLSVQTEYYESFADRTAHGDVQFNGYYVFVSYFLTGEHRPYNRRSGTFDRVRPLENSFRLGTADGNVATGKGAWEIVYRYSFLDLNDGLVRGGYVRDHTLGLSWYLNPHTRIEANYVNSHIDRPRNGVERGNMDIFQMRAEIDF